MDFQQILINLFINIIYRLKNWEHSAKNFYIQLRLLGKINKFLELKKCAKNCARFFKFQKDQYIKRRALLKGFQNIIYYNTNQNYAIKIFAYSLMIYL